MQTKIVLLDLWTDANRGDNSLQVGLIKMLRKAYPQASITGIFRFGQNEFEDARAEISETLRFLDSGLGGIRRTIYAGERPQRSVLYRKLHSFFSFLELGMLLLFLKAGWMFPIGEKQRKVIKLLQSADLVVWKGKNFRAESGFSGIQRQLTLTIAGFISSILCSKTICVNASFWEVKGNIGTWLIKRAFSSCELITVRDHSSLETASRLFGAERVRYCKDLSYYDLHDRLQHDGNLIENRSKRFALGLTITKWGSTALQENYVFALRDLIKAEILRDTNTKIVVIPQVVRRSESSEELVGKIIEGFEANVDCIEGELSIDELLEIYADCSFLVGTRMHSCVFAAAVKTPFLAIAYDIGPKWEILEDLVSRDCIISLAEITPGLLLEKRRNAELLPFDFKLLADASNRNVQLK
jgi:polysaccharide pyruvyl transferase WcaK-like protein